MCITIHALLPLFDERMRACERACVCVFVIAGCVKLPINIVHSTPYKHTLNAMFRKSSNQIALTHLLCSTFYGCVGACACVSSPHDDTLNSKSQYFPTQFLLGTWHSSHTWLHQFDRIERVKILLQHLLSIIEISRFPNINCVSLNFHDNITFWRRTINQLNNYCWKKWISHTIEWFLLSESKIWYDYTHLLSLSLSLSLLPVEKVRV